MPWDFALILAVLGVLVPWRGAARIRQIMRQPQLSSAERLSLYASTIAFQWSASGIVFWRCSARHVSLTELALTMREPLLTATVAGALALAVTGNQLASLRRLSRLPLERQGFLREIAIKVMPQNFIERLAFLALVTTVALCEEFLYRGFVHAVFTAVAGRIALIGVVASAAFFSFAHLYQGRRGIVTTFFAGLVFAGARLWTGSLLPSMLAHFAADLVAGLAAPRLLLPRIPPVHSPGSANAADALEGK